MKYLNNFFDSRRILRVVIYICSIIFISYTAFAQVDTLWFENFDDLDTLAWKSRWGVSAGTWEADIPTSGPGSAYSSPRCAATKLNGNYPPDANTRLERIQSFVVPSASQNPRLSFWHWFDICMDLFGRQDSGMVQIEVGNSAWKTISTRYVVSGGGWTRGVIDIIIFIKLKISEEGEIKSILVPLLNRKRFPSKLELI